MPATLNDERAPRPRLGAVLILAAAVLGGALAAMTGCPKAAAPRAAEQPPPVEIAADRSGVEGLPLDVRIFFRPLPDRMPGAQDDTPALVVLGRKLFFEKGISLTKSQSCADCHRLDEQGAGIDHVVTPKGVLGTPGKRNTPTVLNAGFQIAQFWDGRAADLVEQAKLPLLSPSEMAMRTEADVVNRIKEIPDYRRQFATAFPSQAQPVTFHNIALAIAAFERTLVAPSRFDRYLSGQANAINDREKQGLRRFIDTGCVECHSSYPVGGRLMRKMGVYHPYANQNDLGRFEVTGLESDRLVFKVCMLRNVTLTPPYFSDGQVSTLPEAVRQMAWMQLDTNIEPREIDEIIRFLRTLEGERPVKIDSP